MKEKLFANWGLKLAALFIAFGLWYIWVYSDNPPGEAVYTNIEVNFINEELLQNRNLVSEVLEGTDVVAKVTVSGPMQTLDKMRSLGVSVTATADFAKLNEDDYTIPIVFSLPSQFSGSDIRINLTDGSPVVKLLVEELKSKNVRVSAQITGEVKENYQIVESRTEVNMITVSGGTSKVDQVYQAVVIQDVSGADSDISSSGNILLLDADGNRLDSGKLQRSLYTTNITIRINPTKEIPVIYEVYGEPLPGYLATGVVESTLESVKVVGNSTILNSLDSIVVGGARSPVDITDADMDHVTEFNIRSYLPAGVSLAEGAGDGNVSVRVVIEREIERTYDIPIGNIEVRNVPDGITAELPENEVYKLTLEGLAANLDQVADELRGTMDIAQWIKETGMDEIVSGIYRIPVEFVLPEGVKERRPIEVKVTLVEEGNE